MVLSHFNFSDSLYGPFITETYKRKIQITQNSCLRLIYGSSSSNGQPHRLFNHCYLSFSVVVV
nr:unnamed protein product [Callosobruchus chinensis]